MTSRGCFAARATSNQRRRRRRQQQQQHSSSNVHHNTRRIGSQRHKSAPTDAPSSNRSFNGCNMDAMVRPSLRQSPPRFRVLSRPDMYGCPETESLHRINQANGEPGTPIPLEGGTNSPDWSPKAKPTVWTAPNVKDVRMSSSSTANTTPALQQPSPYKPATPQHRVFGGRGQEPSV